MILAISFANVTPYREAGQLSSQRGPDGRPAQVADVGAPDERQHANYIARLLQGNGLPVLDPRDPNLYENYQSHQPPAYYYLAAAWCMLVAADPQNPNDGFRIRFLNILIGAATILFIYLACLWAFIDRAVAILGSGLVGLMPMFIALNAAVTNDSLLYLCCSAALALVIRSIARGWSFKLCLWLGVIVGIGLLTKTSALALIPMMVVGWWVSRRESREARFLAVAVLISIVFAAGWWTRNLNLYGDPLAMKAFQQSFTGSAHRENLVQMIQGVGTDRELSPLAAHLTYWTQWFGWWTARSYIGVFGYMDIFLAPGWYAIGLTMLILLAGLWLYRIRRVSRDSLESKTYVVCGAFFGVVLLLYLQFNLTYFQAQARYLYPAAGAVALCLSGGTLVLSSRFRQIAIGVALLTLLALDFASLAALSRTFSGY